MVTAFAFRLGNVMGCYSDWLTKQLLEAKPKAPAERLATGAKVGDEVQRLLRA